MGTSNAINNNTAGILGYDAAGTFTTSATVTNCLLVGGASSSGFNTVATANNGVLATNGSGVPSISTTPRVTSITFDGTNFLDSYITGGTFTPTITGSSSNPTPTYTGQTGVYMKIGKLVIFEIVIGISALTGGSGSLQVSGLPFAASINAVQYFAGAVTTTGAVLRTIFGTNANTTVCGSCYVGDSSANTTQLPQTTFRQLAFSGCYFTN